ACDSSLLRYFDLGGDFVQINCESGEIQYEYSDGTNDENYSTALKKSTCAVYESWASYGKTVTAISCKSGQHENAGVPFGVGDQAGITGHCKFGACWLYCADAAKQLSFVQFDPSNRIEADFLVCDPIWPNYGLYGVTNAQCN
ncbi:hypothetical protein PENTCL1PPCAC_30491, partial [Pristionchus entomophagus]